MTDRDPRVDPVVGDELRQSAGSGWFFRVLCRRSNAVSYTSRCGGQHLNSMARATLDDWRSEMRNAEVITRGDQSGRKS